MIDYKAIPIVELIPHSPPMVLINNILNYQEASLLADISITENCKFYESAIQGVPSWAGIEYMAQTIAAFAGIQAKMINEPVKLGFLLGTRKYNIYQQSFQVGETYQIYVEQLYLDSSGLASFDCHISNQQDKIVQARLNVFETHNIEDIVVEE